MAKSIAPTSILKGKDANLFLKEMKRQNTKKEDEIKERINNGGHVDIF